MFKKITSVVAAVAMTIAGFGALPAQAVNYAPNSGAVVTSATWQSTLPSNGQFTIPANTNYFNITKRWDFRGLSTADIVSKPVSVEWTLTKPDGTSLTQASSSMNGFYASVNGSISSNSGSFVNDYPMSGYTINLAGANGVTYNTGTLNFNISTNGSVTSTIPAGTYTLAVTVKVDGSVYNSFTTAGGDTASVGRNELTINSRKTLGLSNDVSFPGGSTYTVSSLTCLDTNQLAVNDVVTFRHVVDGSEVASNTQGADRYVSAEIFNGTGNRWISTGFANNHTNVTITQQMLDGGVQITGGTEFLDANGTDPAKTADNSIAAGLHNIGISATKADGTEVTAACNPTVSGTPVATLNGTNVAVTLNGSFPSNGQRTYTCQAYKASDNTLVGSAIYANTGTYDQVSGGYTSITCGTMSGLPGGVAIYVKVIAGLYDFPTWSGASAASNTVTVPLSGITFTSTASNGTNFGDAKAVTPFDLVSLPGTLSQFSNVVAEPSGGAYEFSRRDNALAVRHLTATGLDSTFGTATATAPSSAYAFGSGFHGTLTSPKPFVTVLPYSQSADLTIIDFNSNGTAGSTRAVSSTQVVDLCKSTFGNSVTMAPIMSAVSAPTTDVYVQVSCQITGINATQNWMLMKVAMTGNAAPTLVAKLYEGTSEFPTISMSGSQGSGPAVPVTLNWTATGAAPQLTFAVQPMKSTCGNGPCTYTFGSAKAVRISAAGAATSADLNLPAPAAGSTLSLNMLPVNFGTIILNRYESTSAMPPVSTRTTYKVGATGAASALTPTWDTTAGLSGVSSVGTVVGTTSDGQMVFLRGEAGISGNKYKLAKMNLTTGAVTTFGELVTFTVSGQPSTYFAPLAGNGVLIAGPSTVNSGKIDMIVIAGASATPTPTPTIPVPTQGQNTDLGLGLNAGGNKIEITGTLLTAVTGVTFNGVALAAGKFVKTATKITITVPAGTTGTVPVALVYAGGTIPVGNYEYIGATKVSQTLAISAGSEIFSVGDADRVLAPTSTYDDDGDSNTAAVDTGLDVTIVSKTPAICTVTQNLLHFVASGTCTIEGTQAGNARFAAGLKVTKVFYVLPTYTGASALYSTDGGKPTITLTGTGLTSVSAVKLGNQVVTDVKSNATGTLLTVKIPVADSTNAANNVADLKLVYGSPANPVTMDTQDDFTFVGGTKMTQTITFTTGSSATYGDAIRSLTASSTDSNSNSLDVVITFKSSTPAVCSVVDGDLRFLASGNCTVVASQPGNAGLAAAQNVSQTITVAKKDQVITIADTTLEITDVQTVSAGVSLDSEPEMEVDYSVDNEDICTVDGDGMITGVGAGTCVITVSEVGDARYNAATSADGFTITVVVTTSTAPQVDLADAEGDGNSPAAAIANGGLKTFTSTNDPGFQLAWDKASGKLIPRATGIYTGFIQAKLTFTKNGVTYTCTNVFGSNAVMKNKKPAEKKAAKASKVFSTTAAFCTDANEIKSSLFTNVVLNPTNFAKIKPSAKVAGAVGTVGTKKYEAAAFPQLKNFTGTVSIEIKRFRAWPTTGVNVTGDKKTGKKIPVTTRNTSVVLQ